MTYANPLARKDGTVVEHVRALKKWTREILELSDADVVSVSELSCSVPDCPPKETIVLIMGYQKDILKVSVHKAMREVTFEALAEVLKVAIQSSAAQRSG